MNQEHEDLLLHWGVKGMKWGVRRDRKSSKLDSKAQKYRDEIDAIKSREPKNKIGRISDKMKTKRLSKKELQAIKDSEAVRNGKLTKREKQAIVGSLIVATLATTVLVSKAQSGEINALIAKGKAYMNKTEPSFKKNDWYAKDFKDPLLLKKLVMPGINDKNVIGGKNNCRRCTIAYEMRRRGFDVEATRTTTGKGQSHMGLYNLLGMDSNNKILEGDGRLSTVSNFVKEGLDVARGKKKSATFEDFFTKSSFSKNGFLGDEKVESGSDMASNIFKSLSNKPNGARGELGIKWIVGGGHSMAWEIVNGKPVIMDTQLGKMFTDIQSFSKEAKYIQDAGFTRLDDKKLNDEFLMRWVKNAK